MEAMEVVLNMVAVVDQEAEVEAAAVETPSLTTSCLHLQTLRREVELLEERLQ